MKKEKILELYLSGKLCSEKKTETFKGIARSAGNGGEIWTRKKF